MPRRDARLPKRDRDIEPESAARSPFRPGWGRTARGGLLRRELDAAVACDRLTAVFQPLRDVRRQCLGRVEPPARWQGPQLGTVTPSAFTPVAEASDPIRAPGAWAEGIETSAQADGPAQQGCDCLQGHGIARPMPLEARLQWQPGWLRQTHTVPAAAAGLLPER